MSQKKYSDEFRAEALKRLEQSSNVSALARELGIRRKWLYRWRDQARLRARGVASETTVEDREKAKLERRIEELERLVGRQAAELDFFKGALRKVEARRRTRGGTGGAASTSRSH